MWVTTAASLLHYSRAGHLLAGIALPGPVSALEVAAGAVWLGEDLRSGVARLDPDTYGGAYLLGLRGLVVIAHGNSSSTAIANAIRYAARGVRVGVVDRLAERLAARVHEAAAP